MKLKKLIFITFLLSLVTLISGCGGIVEITEENAASAAIVDTGVVSSELFEDWTPLVFASGQSVSYNFEINTGVYSVSGNFTLSVSGRAPSNLNFNWRFVIGKETTSGSFKGSSSDFVNRLKTVCAENSVKATVFSSLFSPYEGANMYNQLIAQNIDMNIGEKWTASYQGQNYENLLESIENYGKIDGYTVVSSVNDAPTQIICISPFLPLPSMSIFFLDTDTGGVSHVVCELAGAILP